MSVTGTVQSVGFTSSSNTPTPPEDFYAVLYIQQDLTAAQKLQVLANIGAVDTNSINNLVSNVSLDTENNSLTVTKVNGDAVTFGIAAGQGIQNIQLDADNNLEISYASGTQSIVPISNLFNNFVASVNNKTGSDITLGIEDIENLTKELNSRVPVGITIEIDGETKNLQENPVFSTNSLKFVEQVLTPEQKAVVYSNLDLNIKQKVLFTHTITETDLADAHSIPLQLPAPVLQDEWYDLHINGGFVNDDNYTIEDAVLVINRDLISYPITAGKRITFRYRRS